MNNWNSIYQNKKYYNTMKNLGFDVKLEYINNTEVFYYLNNGKYIAWETNLKTKITSYTMYNFLKVKKNNPDSYFTIVINKENLNFCKRFKRSLKKFYSSKEKYKYGFMEEFKPEILELLVNREEIRDEIDPAKFKEMINVLFANGLLKISFIYDLEESKYKGVICMLVSKNYVNFRYYYSLKENNIGHFLHYFTINKVLFEYGFEYVDLSGYTNKKSEKFKGIDEFKEQFGGEIIEFEKIVNEKRNICCNKF